MKAAAGILCHALATMAFAYGPAALQDEITHLPGAPPVDFRMFSGYIDVSPSWANGSRQIFYWFVEAQSNASEAPVILWTNGGPGCSGLIGFLAEQGPFRVKPDGGSLMHNPQAWNKLANMVFIEQPVGVGFSTTTEDIEYGDHQAVEDMHAFVLNFFERFPEYAGHDFYISSESYGGHYMPMLAKLLLDNGMPDFRGIFLGNPYTYWAYSAAGMIETAWGHQLLPAPLWAQYEESGCKATPWLQKCSNTTAEIMSILQDFDMYALDFSTCTHEGQHEQRLLLRGLTQTQDIEPPAYYPCATQVTRTYLNLPKVRKAIHAEDVDWTECANISWNQTEHSESMMPYWVDLIRNGTLKIMIYSGDDDSVCSTSATQQFVWNLGYSPLTGRNWVPWKVLGQTAGFRTDFDVPTQPGHAASFDFVTVHGAGHMVPATQPERSLALLQSFLTGDKDLPKHASLRR